MSDLIDRGALVDKTEILYQHTESGKIIPWSAVRVCAINNAPTVDAEPVRHGEWSYKWDAERDPKRLFVRIVCSECNLHTGQKSNYCPSCGARMKGEK